MSAEKIQCTISSEFTIKEDKDMKFAKYDVLVEGFRIIQVMAMSEEDAVNIVSTIKGYNVLDVALSLE